jgi:hypothetical protein|nr:MULTISPECIES: hypothetical protein [Caldilinea]
MTVRGRVGWGERAVLDRFRGVVRPVAAGAGRTEAHARRCVEWTCAGCARGSGGGEQRLDGELEAELGEAALGALDELRLVALVVVDGAQILERLALLEHVIERDQDAVGDGDGCAFGAVAAGQALETGCEVGLLDLDCSPGGLHQFGPQVAIAVAGSGQEAFGAAPAIAGAELGPGGQVTRGRVAGHVDAGLGQDVLGQAGPMPGTVSAPPAR